MGDDVVMEQTVQLSLWQVILLIISFLGLLFAFGKLLLAQIDRRLSERFTAIEAAAKAKDDNLQEQIKVLMEQNRQEGAGLARMERDMLAFKAELPLRYVMRDDYVRNQTIIEGKIDAVALRIENLQLRQIAEDKRASR